MKKIFIIYSLITALLSIPATGAGIKTGNFDGISIGDNLNVSVVLGEEPSVDLEIPDENAGLLKCELVGNSILKLSIDLSKAPKELKSKGSFNLKLTVDHPVSSIRICGKSTIAADNGTIGGGNISIQATDQSEISSISISGADIVSVIMNKKAEAKMSVSAKKLMVMSENSSKLELEQTVDESTIEISGSSTIVTGGSATIMKVSAQGSSKNIINGTSDDVSFICCSNSNTNASNLRSKSSSVTMTGLCMLSVGISENLDISSISSGATLEFYGTPVIKINEIKASSVNHIVQQ